VAMADLPQGSTVTGRVRRAAVWLARAAAIVVLAWGLLVAAAAAPWLAWGPEGALAVDEASAKPQADPGKPRLDQAAAPVRIRIPELGIDLPVVSSERTVPGNVKDYPLCDVAAYWTIYDLPGAPGTTWIYAHAQPGMFLPLLLTANASGGDALIGKMVSLQLRDQRLLTYRITQVKQHATDRTIAKRGKPSRQRLVLQTSEGPAGTIPKLQLAATLVKAEWTDAKAPKAQPRACWQARATNGDPKGDDAEPGATAVDGLDGVDGGSLALGGGAVLLGAVVLAVYIVRRPLPSAPRPPRR